MNEEISFEQQTQLKSWATERDSLLSVISVLKNENQILNQRNSELALSSQEIEQKINQSLGRLEELDKREVEKAGVISREISSLTNVKTTLESQITNLAKQVDSLTDKKNHLTEDISTLSDIHSKVFNRMGVLDKVVDHVTRVSDQNTNDISKMVADLKKSIQEIIDVNKQNTQETILIADKLPRMFFDLQRETLLTRKTKYDIPRQ
jgi:chromosome segregation ATPase